MDSDPYFKVREAAAALELAHAFTRDLSGKILTWTAGAQKVYQWTSSEAVGRTSHDLLKTKFPKPLSEINAEFLRAGSWEGELVHRRKDGAEIVVASHWAAIDRDGGSPPALLEINNDITEIRRLNRELEFALNTALAASRAKDEFLAMLSHELRNPLTPVTLALSTLAKRGEANSRELQIIQRQVGHLTRLIEDLLDVERLARGKIELRPDYVELSTLIATAAEAVLPLIESKRHHLDVQIPQSGLLIFGDGGRLRQVFANLLNNAARYTPPGGHISVRAERAGSEVVVVLRDDGEGIDPNSLPNIFDMFFQRPRPADRAEGGLGLGLTLVKRLVELHSGQVTAASAGAGQGSQFTVKLPLSRSAAPSGLRESSRIASGHRLKILVVEDYPDIAETISELLRLHGHQVEAVSDGLAALELLTAFSADVAFIDIGLPVMDGYELAKQITERMPDHIPTMIALSGYGQPSDLEKSRSAGFHHHLVKPIDMRGVLKALASLPT
jgi:PAS domain S-box-containing protein